MLTIHVPGGRGFDPKRNEFVTYKPTTIVMEHSLVSISKWESKWKKSFLNTKEKTYEETLDYMKCMTITQGVDESVYLRLGEKEASEIADYINDSMTATWFSDDKRFGRSREIITSEIIYYWMISAGIPMECQKWHLNRLLTLIRVIGEKNKPQKKMSPRAINKRNAALNKARRKRLGTKG